MNVVTRGYGKRSGMAASFGYGRRKLTVIEAFREVIDFCVYVIRELRFDVER